MKKFLFFFALTLFSVVFLPAFGQKQYTDQQIRVGQLVLGNRTNNPHVSNPDSICPGQPLFYRLEDGFDTAVIVKPGDTQEGILTPIVEKKHLGVVVNEPVEFYQLPEVNSIKSKDSFTIPWYGWIILVLISLLILWGGGILFIEDRRKADPVNAGPAQVPGGVRDSGAYSRMREVAQNRFPGARLDIRNIRRGRLSGLATVHYASGSPRKLNLIGTPAYAGEVMVNDRTETIYFLQGCGNDARQGNYMSGNNLVFEPDVVINEDGSESPLSTPSASVTEIVSELTPVVPVEVIRSEYDGQVGQAMKLAEKVVTANPSHQVDIEIPKGEGSFKMTIKGQYPPKGNKWPEKDEKEIKK